MGLYNCLIFRGQCPKCGDEGWLRAQFHVATSADRDEAGRFCLQVYRIGDRLRWWPPSDRRYGSWSKQGVPGDMAGTVVRECCYSHCETGHELYAIVEFAGPCVRGVIGVGEEENWPPGYPR
jgi:hypothetical protein